MNKTVFENSQDASYEDLAAGVTDLQTCVQAVEESEQLLPVLQSTATESLQAVLQALHDALQQLQGRWAAALQRHFGQHQQQLSEARTSLQELLSHTRCLRDEESFLAGVPNGAAPRGRRQQRDGVSRRLTLRGREACTGALRVLQQAGLRRASEAGPVDSKSLLRGGNFELSSDAEVLLTRAVVWPEELKQCLKVYDDSEKDLKTSPRSVECHIAGRRELRGMTEKSTRCGSTNGSVVHISSDYIPNSLPSSSAATVTGATTITDALSSFATTQTSTDSRATFTNTSTDSGVCSSNLASSYHKSTDATSLKTLKGSDASMTSINTAPSVVPFSNFTVCGSLSLTSCPPAGTVDSIASNVPADTPTSYTSGNLLSAGEGGSFTDNKHDPSLCGSPANLNAANSKGDLLVREEALALEDEPACVVSRRIAPSIASMLKNYITKGARPKEYGKTTQRRALLGTPNAVTDVQTCASDALPSVETKRNNMQHQSPAVGPTSDFGRESPNRTRTNDDPHKRLQRRCQSDQSGVEDLQETVAWSDTLLAAGIHGLARQAPAKSRPLHGMDEILMVSTTSLNSINASTGSRMTRPLHMEPCGTITAIESPSLFFMQRSADTRRLEKLFKHLNVIAATAKAVVKPVTGEVYLGQFSQDGNWYRAEVVRSLTESENGRDPLFWVHYVDYGNSERLRASKLRVCPVNYKTKNLPCFAVACGLWGLVPSAPHQTSDGDDDLCTDPTAANAQNSDGENITGETVLKNGEPTSPSGEVGSSPVESGGVWSPTAQRLFGELVSQAPVQVLVMAIEESCHYNHRRKCLVEVRRVMHARGVTGDEPVSLRQLFLELGLATLLPGASPPPVKQATSSSQSCRSYFKPDMVSGHEEVSVYPTEFCSPHRLYLQLSGPSYSEQLDILHDKIQEFYGCITSIIDWTLYLPTVGSPCVACSSVNNAWYRARVEELSPGTTPGDQRALIFYVDYGRLETLPYTSLRKIKDVFMELPAQALQCRLSNIEPVEGVPEGRCSEDPALWDPEAKAVVDAFVETLSGPDCFSMIFHSVESGGRCLVSLFVRPDTCNTLDLAHHLVRLGHARLSHSPAGAADWGRADVAGLDGQVITALNSFGSASRGTRCTGRASQSTAKSSVSEAWVGPPSIGSRQAVSVLYLGLVSPSAIFVRLASRTPHYNQLQGELDGEMERQKEVGATAADVTPGRMVLAVFPSYPFIARAKILLSDEGSETVKAVLVDCGGIVSVPVSALRPLPPALVALKPIALLVSLHDIAPPGGQQKWPCTTVDALRDLLTTLSNLYLLKQGCSVRVTSLYNLKVLPVALGYTAEVAPADQTPLSAPPTTHRVSVSQQLVQAGLALPIRAAVIGNNQDLSSRCTSISESFSEVSNTQSSTVPTKQILNTGNDVTSADKLNPKPKSSIKVVSPNTTERRGAGVDGISSACAAANGEFMVKSLSPEVLGSGAGLQELPSEKRLNASEDPFSAFKEGRSERRPLIETVDFTKSEVFSAEHRSDNAVKFVCLDIGDQPRVVASPEVAKQIISEGKKRGENCSEERQTDIYDKLLEDISNKNTQEKTGDCRRTSRGHSIISALECHSNASGRRGSTSSTSTKDNITTAMDDIREYFSNQVSPDNCVLALNKTKWLPVPELQMTNFSAIPTFVDDNARIYLHPLSSEHCLSLLRDTLLLQYKDSLPEIMMAQQAALVPGDAVIARYSVDGFFHRATILEVDANGQNVLLTFVDYGNREHVSVHDLRLPMMYGDLPAQCHVCKLHDLEPNNTSGRWQTGVLDLLHITIVEKVCRVTVMPTTGRQRPGRRRLPRIELLVESSELDVTKMLVERLKYCRRKLHKTPRVVRRCRKRDGADHKTPRVVKRCRKRDGADDCGQAAANADARVVEYCSQESDEDSPDVLVESGSDNCSDEGTDASSATHGSRNSSAAAAPVRDPVFFGPSTNPHSLKKAKLSSSSPTVLPLPLPTGPIFFPVQVTSIIDPATLYVTTLFPGLGDNDHQLIADGNISCGACIAVAAVGEGDAHVGDTNSKGAGDHSERTSPVGVTTACEACQQRHQALQQQYWRHRQLMEEVQLDAHQLLPVDTPLIGGLYLCYLSHSHQWHRCQALEEVPSHLVEPTLQQEYPGDAVLGVMLLEFGCEEQVPRSQLRLLPAELREVPAQCAYVRCRGLADGGDDGYWKPDTMAKMIQLVFADDEQLYATVTRQESRAYTPHEVELYHKMKDGSMKLCYQGLIDSGVLAYTAEDAATTKEAPLLPLV